jgi:hypothetical protein
MQIRIGEQLPDGKPVIIETSGQTTTLWDDVCIGIRTQIGFFVVTSNPGFFELEKDGKVIFTTDTDEEKIPAAESPAGGIGYLTSPEWFGCGPADGEEEDEDED